MLMISDVAQCLINFLAEYGDLPCVLEHHSTEQDGVLLDPLEDVVLLTISQVNGTHTEACVLFTERHVRDGDTFGSTFSLPQ